MGDGVTATKGFEIERMTTRNDVFAVKVDCRSEREEKGGREETWVSR